MEGKISKFNTWRKQYLTERQFILLLSILVGLSAGIVSVFIKNSVVLIEDMLTSEFSIQYENFLYIVYPGIGLLLTVLFVRFVIKKKTGEEIPEVLYAISRMRSIIPKYRMYASMISSIIVVGFGGSVGLEGPTAGTSAAIGSNIARKAHLNYNKTTLMLGCGAAGAIAGIFGAPIAAIVFALEVIMLDLTAGSLIPLILASVSAALTSSFIFGNATLFDVAVVDDFAYSDILLYVLLGVITGMVSVYFIKTFWGLTTYFGTINNIYKRLFFGAIVLGGLIFLVPPLYGEGFATINKLLDGEYLSLFENTFFYEYRHLTWVAILLLAGLVFLKAIATSVTIGAGGIGGIFAPSLFLGSVTGFVFAKIFNLLDFVDISEKNFTLVGMAGLLAGVLHAPLTALFLIAEITGGYRLFIPLMITSAIAFLTARYFAPHSIYNMQLAKKGDLITHNKDKAVLTLMKLDSEVERDFIPVKPNDTLGELVKTVSKSRRNIFPVVDEQGILKGIVLLDDIRKVMFQPEQYEMVFVHEIMNDFPAVIDSKDNMADVMDKFQKTGAWNLPVIEDGKYAGFLSKSKLFNAYRQILQEFTHE